LRPAWKNKDKSGVPAEGPPSTGHGRILILSLTFWCLAMVAAVWWYYNVQKRETEAATMRAIFAVAAGTSSQVANWRRERIGDGHVLMSAPVMRTARRVLESRTTAEADRADLLDLMARLSGANLYTDGALVDLSGNVRLRLHDDGRDSSQFGQSARRDFARQANLAGDVILSDLTQATRTGAPLMALAVPVRDLGSFILDIDPERFLYPYLKAWPGSSGSAESLLVRVDGKEIVYLNAGRHTPGITAFSRRPLTMRLPPDAVLNAGWRLVANDYRGVPVIGTIRRIPDSPWYLASRINVAEVDAPLRRLGWEMALITALIALANVTGAAVIWRGHQARIHRDREAWFYALANDTPACLWMASAGEENSFINLPMQKFLGTNLQRLSKSWIDHVHADDAGRTRAGFLAAMAEQRGSIDEFRMRRFDGEYRTVAGEAKPRFSASGQFLGYAGCIVDITERRRAEEQLRAANEELQTELAERIRKEQEIQALSDRLIGAREDERRRLARELHDGLNQQIAAVSIAIGNLKRNIPAELTEARAQSDRIHQKLAQLADSVRQMSHELHPAMLEFYGLTAALRSFCEEFQTLTHVRVAFHSEGACDQTSPATALCVYRITQEALQNVAKHAQAAAAEVKLSHAEGILCLTVADTGVGMEPAASRKGLGLLSIRERARLAGGGVEISSQPREGTRVTLRVPV